MAIHIFCQYWSDAPDYVRDAIRKNYHLPDASLHIFIETGTDVEWADDMDGIDFVHTEKRITYTDFLQRIGEFPVTDYAVLLNSDITVTESTVSKLPPFSSSTALCVSRREMDGSLPSSAEGTKPDNCQDVWIMRGHTPTDELLTACSNLTMGLPGCENRFAAELAVDGYSVYNPCYDLAFTHNTKDPVLSYPDPNDSRRYNGLYAYLAPCSTHDVDVSNYRQFLRYYPKVRGVW